MTCCSVLQSVECVVLQCVAVCCSTSRENERESDTEPHANEGDSDTAHDVILRLLTIVGLFCKRAL